MNNPAMVDQTATAADLFNQLPEAAQDAILELARQLLREQETEAKAQRRG